jgi:hypothetical protein
MNNPYRGQFKKIGKKEIYTCYVPNDFEFRWVTFHNRLYEYLTTPYFSVVTSIKTPDNQRKINIIVEDCEQNYGKTKNGKAKKSF